MMLEAHDEPAPADEVICGLFQYVRHSDVAKFEALGWVNVGHLPAHHGHYSCLMRFADVGEVQQ